MNEEKKYQLIKNLVDNGGNKQRTAAKLGCTIRTVNRLIKRYKEEGKAAFSHGNKGHKPARAIPYEKKEAILLLHDSKYYDCNIRHFTELLERHESIKVSENTVRAILLEEDILSPKAHKATKKALKKRLKEKMDDTTSKKKKAVIQENILAIEDAHFRRSRCKHFGEMIQMDASVHLWFGDEKTQLHAAIDDATGTIVAAYFDKQETLNGYYNLFYQILSTYGIPYMFYTDRRTVFEYKQKGSSKLEEDTFTQFAYACKQLGVELKTTSIPQAKGRIERLFETLQSRLPVELRLAGVTTIEQANEFLKLYLKEFNAQFALPVDSTKSVFEKQPEPEAINLYLSILTGRKIDSGHCIRFKNNMYIPIDENGSMTPFTRGTEVLIAETFDKRLFCTINERVYALKIIESHETVSRYFNTKKEIETVKKPKKQYIPDMNHPWKKDNFMKYVYAMVGREMDWAC